MDLNKTILIGIVAVVVLVGAFTVFKTTGFAAAVDPIGTGASTNIGDNAPLFSLKNLDGKTINLADYKGKTVVLFFNEGGMCYPSCWNQIKELAVDERFNNSEVVSFSIVVDSESDWKKITSQVPGFPASGILFDSKAEVSSKYGALDMPSSMHGGQMPGHTYYIIDGAGVLRYVFDDPKMGVRNEMLAGEIAKFA
ncbi:MAG: redoxin domain-containing protein [archaeon]|nr:redoxin domain-containing protein [archaeon]